MISFTNLVKLARGTGGLELYFVEAFYNVTNGNVSQSSVAGVNSSEGLAIVKSADALVLAHEIGHAFGLSDIYEIEGSDRNQVEYVCKTNMPYDWNGGCDGTGQCGMRYYRAGMLQRDAIRQMLMNGETSVEDEHNCRDITAGYVRGALQSSAFINSRRGAADVGFYYPSFLEPRHD